MDGTNKLSSQNWKAPYIKRIVFSNNYLPAIGRMLHVVELYSYHTGQIALWTKMLTEKDLGFYEDFDLNQKNEP